jgi:hypothetical protein
MQSCLFNLTILSNINFPRDHEPSIVYFKKNEPYIEMFFFRKARTNGTALSLFFKDPLYPCSGCTTCHTAQPVSSRRPTKCEGITHSHGQRFGHDFVVNVRKYMASIRRPTKGKQLHELFIARIYSILL